MIDQEGKQETKRVRHRRSGSWVTALIFIFVGSALLLNNFGLIPWTFWNSLWRFWPVIIILWGLELITGQRFASRVIGVVLSLLVLALVFAYAFSGVNSQFDNWMQQLYPRWKQLRQQLPQDDNSNPPFQSGRKVFRCDPQTGECSLIYK